MDITQLFTSVLVSLVPEMSFTVEDTEDAAENIVKHIVQNIRLLGMKSIGSSLGVGIPFYLKFYIEGDLLIDGSDLSSNYTKIVKRINEELPEIDYSTQAYYDLVEDVLDDKNKRVFTSASEIKISLSKDGFLVNIHHVSNKWLLKDVFNRMDSLFDDEELDTPKEILNNFRYSSLDVDLKGNIRKTKDKSVSRFSGLDLNSKRKNKKKLKPEFEALLFQQDTQQDQTQVKTAAQRLGKQVATQQVAKSIQSKVDKMSYQQAYDAVENAMKVWDDTDPYEQYTDTIELASKWYGDNLVLVNGFDIIDKIYYAADLARKISELEEAIYNTKSRSAIAKLEKELDTVKKDLSKITPEIQASLQGAKGYDAVEARAKELEDKMDDYVEDYHSNISEWKAIKGKMEKAGKLIETMEAIKEKYAGQYDLPPLMSRYKSLMQTPIPTIMDVESMETPDLNSVYTAWRQSMQNYRKELESFTESIRANYDVLAKLLALKAKSKSLF